MQSLEQANLNSITDSFKNEDPIRSKEAEKIANSLSKPLLNSDMSLQLNLEEIPELWKAFYSERFDVCLDVCTNPLDSKKEFKFEQVTIMDALVSSSLYFGRQKSALENDNGNDEKEECIGLFYNILKYIISYKFQDSEPDFHVFLKDAVYKILRSFITFILVQSNNFVFPDPSQPEQRPTSQLFKEILSAACQEAFDRIQKEESDEPQESKNFYYELAELLYHYAQNIGKDSSEGPNQKVITEPLETHLSNLTIEKSNLILSEQPQNVAELHVEQEQIVISNLSAEIAKISDVNPGFLGSVGIAAALVEAPSVDKAQWMKGIFDSIKSKTLGQIMIPGSHDAGTFEMNWFVRDWTKCQGRNFADQLNAGARYLDCRLTHYPGNSKDLFWFAHASFTSSTKLQVLLDTVKDFLDRTSHEIVILDFSHFLPDTNEEHKKQVLSFFMPRLSLLAPYIAGSNFAERTIQELVDKKTRLVLLSDENFLNTLPQQYFGRTINLYAAWVNTPQIDVLETSLNEKVNEKQDYEQMYKKDLHLTQAILSQNLKKAYLPLWNLANKVASWMPIIYQKQDWLRKINVIFTDYVGNNGIVELAIHANANIRTQTPA